MKNIFLFLGLFILTSYQTINENKDEKAIKKVMMDQQLAWNNYDLEAFMEGYWKSEDLKFYGSSGITHGWKNTLERYKKNYPSKEYTGTLKFVLNEISKINETSYYVMGEYHLERAAGNADGIFMIIFKKIQGNWKIIADTSCKS